MTISLKHAFTSAKSDDGDTTLVRPSNWNAEHTITAAANKVLGTVTAGAVGELGRSELRTLVGVGPALPHGRLTLTTGTPVTTADVSGATSIYWDGTSIPVYDGTSLYNVAISGGELTLALDGDSGHTGYHQSGKIFDLFYAYVSGTLYFGTGPAWTNTTTRSAAVSRLNGLMSNTSTMTLRHGSATGNTVSVPANQATLLGSFCATADGQASDTVLLRYLSNLYGKAGRALRRIEATASWNYSTTAYRQMNGSTSNQVAVLDCIGDAFVDLAMSAYAVSSTTTFVEINIGIGINSSTVSSATMVYGANVNSLDARPVLAQYRGFPGMGVSELRALEYGSGSGGTTQTWVGTASGSQRITPGLDGYVFN